MVNRYRPKVQSTAVCLGKQIRTYPCTLTETPYPYPGSLPSQPAMEGLLRVPVEALPNYSTGIAEQHLRTLETLLLSNGFRVIYAG